MTNKGVTLVEMAIALTIGVILISLSMAYVLVGHGIVTGFTGRYGVVTEADIAVGQIVRTLRFAKGTTVTAAENMLTATIQAGHLNDFLADTEITYARDPATNILTYTKGLATSDLATGITYFYSSWDPSGRILTIRLTAQSDIKKVPVETRVKVLVE